MGRINIGKLVIGGVAAGLVANALDFVVNTYLMTTETDDMIRRLNLSLDVLQSSAMVWVVVDFIWGMLLVFAYVGMRPRFGPGPRTAAISGGTMWLAVAATFAGLTAMGIYTQQAYIKTSFLFLVSTMAASLTGAYLYQED
jgi:hypothetical protein